MRELLPRTEIPALWALVAWWPLTWITIGILLSVAHGWWSLLWWFGLPPALHRVVGRHVTDGRHAIASVPAFAWWVQYQLQLPFIRLPWFEEVLRLIPGAASAWMALWGGHLSPWAHVAPGVVITDRSRTLIARSAVIGNGVLLGGHAVGRDRDGAWWVEIGAVRIEAGAVIGARCVIGPGSRVAPNEVVTATAALPPGTTWIGGRRELRHD